MDQKIASEILRLTGSSKIHEIELVQELWAGYGQLLRLKLDQKTLILKHITFPKLLPHQKDTNIGFAHTRKVKSYNAEFSFYEKFHSHKKNSPTPCFIGSGAYGNTKYLLLQDLKELKYGPKTCIDQNQLQGCLSWLANFHFTYLENSNEKCIWEVGTYWNLATRPYEFKNLKDPDLIKLGPIMDKTLNESKFKTIIHGDAKLANFLFNKEKVSAVDFQYVGFGSGIKDVIYFMSSVFDEKELFENEEFCLDYYFNELKRVMIKNGQAIKFLQLEKEWRKHYPYAWCDFFRFLSGWSPNHYKINKYIHSMKSRVLNELK